mgnify:CR=1 FL=1|jgi:hypothetical protein
MPMHSDILNHSAMRSMDAIQWGFHPSWWRKGKVPIDGLPAEWMRRVMLFYFGIHQSSSLSIHSTRPPPISMKVRPDLSYPGVPDVDELVHHPRHVDQGGTSLRDDSFEWPESGPSESSKVKGNDPRLEDDPAIGPFGAKVIAAMTGAMTTSLLSRSLFS